MKKFLAPLILGLVCGVVVFIVIVVLNTVLPSPNNVEIAATAGVVSGSIEAFIVYSQRKAATGENATLTR